MATLAEYRNKVFTQHAVDMLINKARPIRDILQRFNKKDSARAEEPHQRDLAMLMKFIEDDTLQTLSKHLYVAFGAMYLIATHIMTLETLFSHPAEFAKKHRESLEVQAFKQNPSRESMVAYIASQTLTHNEIISEDEQGANIWDILTQRAKALPSGMCRNNQEKTRTRATTTTATMMKAKRLWQVRAVADLGETS